MVDTEVSKVAATPNTFIVGIDGSEGSHNAFELVVKDLYKKGTDKVVLVHIFNSKKEHELGPSYKPKTIYNKYIKELEKYVNENEYEFVMEDRKQNENVLEQVHEIATAKKGTILVLGFRGYKGAEKRPDELSKSVTYLVHKPLIPVLVVKEKIERLFRTNSQFKWLVALEDAESKSFKALESVIRYIDSENDLIHGITIVDGPKGVEKGEAVKAKFDETLKKYGISNFDFNILEKENTKDNVSEILKKWISEHLKKENHWLDFVVTGYNASKYAFNKNASNATVEILKNVNINVFFEH